MSELTDTKRMLVDLKASLGTAYTTACDALTKLDALPVEPDVYEQIRERYGKPFSELLAPDGYFFLTAGLKEFGPVFRRADDGELYLCIDGSLGIGSNMQHRLILRPAKQIVFVEDPLGAWMRTEIGCIMNFKSCYQGVTRYRLRGGTP